jgi:hypothetical protein
VRIWLETFGNHPMTEGVKLIAIHLADAPVISVPDFGDVLCIKGNTPFVAIAWSKIVLRLVDRHDCSSRSKIIKGF